ncbi:DNA-3-methyladenine glycosylase 2 [Rouxiella badensis]|uniref:DNA-3-methyladenine glycosylase 2 n=1 Tax=Rouxiella badensis TaxID=1646377 RepID=UPI001D14E4C6|nr:DNA-3-methyladenine glycosylase 2 [Rouxiella badensis]MCC3733762.1 DNA-3-methyladenine glycosylase 2 [Rouxiella badensis]MCC3759585.1 DNA-3-methyladenine glycosylase 2 [Rouxiella badensis]
MANAKYLLPYNPPYDWGWMTAFLGARALAGIEQFEDQGPEGFSYKRTLAIKEEDLSVSGWLSWRPRESLHAVELEVSPSLVPHIETVKRRVRNLLDLDADPQAIAQALGPLAEEAAGLRLPGCIDSFELAVHAILGQLVSVKMAATFCTRLARLCGETVDTPYEALTHLFPTPARVAALEVDALRALGVQAKRAACLINLAKSIENGELPLYGITDARQGMKQLLAMPGIGGWTASYIAMRAWGERDLFLHSDYLIKQRFPNMTPGTINRYAEIWKPWRSYATLLIWNSPNWKPE